MRPAAGTLRSRPISLVGKKANLSLTETRGQMAQVHSHQENLGEDQGHENEDRSGPKFPRRIRVRVWFTDPELTLSPLTSKDLKWAGR